MLHRGVDDLVLDCKNAYFRVGTVRVVHDLPVPLHLVNIKRNLLHRLELNNLGNTFLFNRWKLDKTCKAALSGNRNGHLLSANFIA